MLPSLVAGVALADALEDLLALDALDALALPVVRVSEAAVVTTVAVPDADSAEDSIMSTA